MNKIISQFELYNNNMITDRYNILTISVISMFVSCTGSTDSENKKTNVILIMTDKQGPVTLHSWFCDADQQTLCGAYYVYVKKLF